MHIKNKTLLAKIKILLIKNKTQQNLSSVSSSADQHRKSAAVMLTDVLCVVQMV